MPLEVNLRTFGKETLAALATTSGDNVATSFGRHPGAESVLTFASSLGWLKGALHILLVFLKKIEVAALRELGRAVRSRGGERLVGRSRLSRQEKHLPKISPSPLSPRRLESLRFMATTRTFTVNNKLGIHARPAAQFVKIASRFQCDITVEKDGEEIDGKSIMGLMMLAAGHGSTLDVTATGADEEEALEALQGLVDRNFEE